MAQSRLDLQLILEAIPGVQMVKFQPPDSTRLVYPCNRPFRTDTRYMITVIDRNPDSLIPSLVAKLPYCSFSRFYVADDLNHDVYTLYF
jgi:hypothetical protein